MFVKVHYVTVRQDPYVADAYRVTIDGREYQTRDVHRLRQIDRMAVWNVDFYGGIELTSSIRCRGVGRYKLDEHPLPMASTEIIPDYDHVKHDPNSPWLLEDD